MIGRNETPSKKARFWQSFVRSLKGKHKKLQFIYNWIIKWTMSHHTPCNSRNPCENHKISKVQHFSPQDRKTSEPRRGTGPAAVACSPSSWALATPTASPSTTTPSAPPSASPSPGTATCPSTARPTGTPHAPSTPTTTRAPLTRTGQVSTTV